MKVSKKYNQIVKKYHCNKIQDYESFENMETHHFYHPEGKEEISLQLRGLLSFHDEHKKAIE